MSDESPPHPGEVGGGLMTHHSSLITCSARGEPIELALAQDGLDPRDVLAHLLRAGKIRQLAGCLLDAQIELLLIGVAQPLLQLRVAQLMRLTRLHWMP